MTKVSQDLIAETHESTIFFIVMVVGAVVALAIGLGILLTAGMDGVVPAIIGGSVFTLIGLFLAFISLGSVKSLGTHKRFYGDHVEFRKGDKVRTRLTYEDATRVDYGYRPDDGSQYLGFGDKDWKNTVYLATSKHDEPTGGEDPTTASGAPKVTPDRLREIRDRVVAAVAGKLAKTLQREGRVHWFSKVFILKDGLEIQGKTVAAQDVQVNTEDRTGILTVSGPGVKQQISLTGTDVLPGLRVYEEHFLPQ